MRKHSKRIGAFLMSLLMSASVLCTPAFASEVGEKNAKLVSGSEDRYKITIDVPGKDGEKKHDEVILMVDGSYSGDKEWPAMKEAINSIGKALLDGSGNMQLTLMAFGMGDNEVLVQIKDADELAAALGELPGYLLRGVSSTNCEAGFTGVDEYIDNNRDLKDALVIYITDGGINTDETPRFFYNWREYAPNLANVRGYALDGVDEATLDEAIAYVMANKPADISVDEIDDEESVDEVDGEESEDEVDGEESADEDDDEESVDEVDDEESEDEVDGEESEDEVDDEESEEKNIEKQNPNSRNISRQKINKDDLTEEELNAVVDYLWAKVFEHSQMDINEDYPISEMERAFLQYDENHNSQLHYSFLIAMKGSSLDKYPNVWNRTYDSVFDLAGNEKVEALYLVRYQNDKRATWMPDAAAVSEDDNIHYVKSDSISTLTDTLQGTLEDLAKTPFNNVVVTDYMSKWVNLDPDTLEIVDNTTGNIIWSAEKGWLINENRPTAAEVPVEVELVNPADYEKGGADVIGNTSGEIYKLTWHVKDGAMLRVDNYTLQYEVTVDVDEAGFRYDVEYPANGNTDLYYDDEDGNPQKDEIDVPDVEVKEEDREVVREEEEEEDEEDEEDEPSTINIDDDETPLTEAPTELIEILDELIPLASAPQTGVNNTPWSLMVAAAGLALAAVLGKKNK